MTIDTEKYVRKPLYVDAVRITPVNFDEIAVWCQGTVENDPETNKMYIRVRVHNPKNVRQSKAYVGDWLLYTERGYKVYTSKPFFASFDKVSVKQDGVDMPSTSVHKEQIEFVTATPQTIASAVLENATVQVHDARTGKVFTPSPSDPIPTAPQAVTVEEIPNQETVEPAAVEGKHVLSIEEQKDLTSIEIKELVQSGEAVLAQDIAQ